ncbi:MAG: methyltransferase domain-containing protein [Alphaproteobacteria bacterium]|nr:methyltransferase domain-containing protein [Alphaproteobacteria bacterium]MCB9793664.1 methyltransferase domain-containing protein [Alphaproteobacteria bacterium]
MSEPTTLDPGQYAGWRATPLGTITERLELDLVFDLAGPVEGRSVLDVGTGDGSYALEAASRGATVTGVDVDPEMLRAAAQRASAMNLELTLLEGRAERLPVDAERFDLVLAVTVLCFVEDPTAGFRELARVLRPGGRVVIGELGRHNLWAASRRVRGWLGSSTWRAAHVWTRGELRRHLREAGLDVEDVRGAIHYPPSARAARLLAPVDPWLSRAHAPGAAFLAVSAVRPR